MRLHTMVVATIALLACGGAAMAQMRITEWAYQGGGSEFIEFTNVGLSPINMTGWSYDDEDAVPGAVSLGAFGSVAPGESVVLTEITAAAFRTAWGLSASVKVIGGNTNNLGRNDQINLYNNANALVDTLRYGDDSYKPGSIRTNTASGNPNSLATLGTNNVYNWVLSVNGDSYGSHVSVSPNAGGIGNPGAFSLYQVPEPSSIAMLLIGVVLAGGCGLRKFVGKPVSRG